VVCWRVSSSNPTPKPQATQTTLNYPIDPKTIPKPQNKTTTHLSGTASGPKTAIEKHQVSDMAPVSPRAGQASSWGNKYHVK